MREELLSLLPFAIATIIFFLFSIPICRRKGKSVAVALLCLIPFVAIFILLYLVSLPDKQILDRLAALEGKSAR
jgi:hypothetical protein